MVIQYLFSSCTTIPILDWQGAGGLTEFTVGWDVVRILHADDNPPDVLRRIDGTVSSFKRFKPTGVRLNLDIDQVVYVTLASNPQGFV